MVGRLVTIALEVIPASIVSVLLMLGSIAFSPDGTLLATAEIESWFGPGAVKLWIVAKGELLSKFPSGQDP